jgi:hypothetical protein
LPSASLKYCLRDFSTSHLQSMIWMAYNTMNPQLIKLT